MRKSLLNNRNMKKFIILVAFITMVKFLNAQNWHWSHNIGGADLYNSSLICIDSSGNVYVSGKFESNPCYFNTATIYPNGFYDFYLVKYDANGNELWVKSFGGLNGQMDFEGLNSLVYRHSTTSLLVSGTIHGTGVFGNDTIFGNSDFSGELDSDGNFLWVRKYTSAGALAIDEFGNIFSQHTMLSTGLIDTLSVTSGTWLSKSNPNGSLLWAKKLTENTTKFTSFKICDNKLFGIGYCSVDSTTIDTVTIRTNFSNGQQVLLWIDTT